MDVDTLCDIKSENASLGSILYDNSVMHDIAALLKPDDFSGFGQKEVYVSCLELYLQSKAIDFLTLTAHLQQRGIFDKIGGDVFLAELAQSTPHHLNAVHYAEIVKDKSVRRKLFATGQEIIGKVVDTQNPTLDVIDYATNSIFAVAVDGTKENVVEVRDKAKTAMEVIDARIAKGDNLPGLSTSIPSLDDRIGGYQGSHMIVVAGRPGSGKAQPVTSPVLTPSGFVPIGDLKVGDFVIGPSGKPVRVNGFYPQGEKTVYRCYFNDNSVTECCDEHLWEVWTFGTEPGVYDPKVLQLSEIRKQVGKAARSFSIRSHEPVEYEQRNPPDIHPYVMGFWLSEGQKSGKYSFKFSNPEFQVVSKVESLLPVTDRVIKRGFNNKPDYAIIPQGPISSFQVFMERYGLFPFNPPSRHIPDDYLYASVEDRLEFLRGFVDGSKAKFHSNGCFRIHEHASEFRSQLVSLIRSLGGYAEELVRFITIQFPENRLPFSSARHRADYSPPKKRLLRRFVHVAPKYEQECVCISVDGSLYLTDCFLVTHNTSFVINEVESLARNTDKSVLFFSLEMSEEELFDKILANRANVDSKKIKRPKRLTPKERQRLEVASKSLEEDRGRIFIIDRAEIGATEIAALCKKYASKAENNLGLIVVDYLQLISLPEGTRDSEATAIGKVSRLIKVTAKDIKVPIIALSQLNRSLENREEHRPRMADIRSSGSIEQDADIILFLYNPSSYDPNDQPGLIEIITGKNRHGEQGTDYAIFHKPSGRFLSVGRRDYGPRF